MMSFRLAKAPRALRIAAPRPNGRRIRVKAADDVAIPYAAGILDLAQERNILDNVYNDLMGLQSAKSDDEDPPENELREFLLGVPLGNEKRKDILDTLGKEVGMKQETVDFLKLLVDTNRLEAVESIITVFETRYNELTDTQIVTLKSAARLEQEQEYEIAKHLQELTKSKNIKIKPVIDEALIGGFVVEFGDNRVDLSIKGHLDRIEQELMGAAETV